MNHKTLSRIIDLIIVLLFVLLIIVQFGLAGLFDYEEQQQLPAKTQHQIQYEQEQSK